MRRKPLWLWLIVGLAVLSLAACQGQDGGSTTGNTPPVVTIYKSPTCGCCGAWAEHMQQAGFQVREVNLSPAALQQLKAKYGVPPNMVSCHTAIVDGYVVEGHVPAQEVQRLLKERPPVKGIAVPGMPVGSPGMEVPGGQVQPYTVYTFDEQGNAQPVANYP